MRKLYLLQYENKGVTAKLCKNISDRWLKGIVETNPTILTMFADRDIKPYRDLLAWSGEFAGKYLSSAYFVYKQIRDDELKKYVLSFIDQLLSQQDEDGYLGCYSRQTRFTGALPQTPDNHPWTWDCWAHYHIAYGLLLWYRETANKSYFYAVEKIADLLIKTFYNGRKSIVSTGCSEMNLAVYHLFGILYNETQKKEYLDFAFNIEQDMSAEGAGDWLCSSLAGQRFCDGKKPRWESLHIIMGFAEWYKATGDKKYLTALQNIVTSILETDVHNTGGFSTGEQAIGTPYKNGVIETCCVVAFDALVLELYKLTGKLSLIDFLEQAHYNAAMGAVSPSGAWATYDTPMEGEKIANFHGCDFQSRAGSPMLNCCSVNFPRGVAEIYEWTIMEDEEKIYINSYEDAFYRWSKGKIEISGGYPFKKDIHINCRAKNSKKKILIRIPSWSKNTLIIVNGKNRTVRAGEYVEIPNSCNAEISFDFSIRFEEGKEDYKGKFSVYMGPILLAYDLSYNKSFCYQNGGCGISNLERLKEIEIPMIRFSDFVKTEISFKNDDNILVKLENGMILIDFYHAGATGSLYKTWLTIQ